jgi:ComF family protein
VAYGSYDGALRDLIHLLKFDQVRPAAPVLGRMLAECVASLEPALPAGSIAVVPVPLHAKKRSQRGFNQAEVIAQSALKHLERDGERFQVREVGAGGRFELCARVLVRRRETGSQIGLTRHQRRENLRGAFAVKDATRIANRTVLLVDDVYTTGATASECARVLQRAGASRVWVASVGRTLKIFNAIGMPEIGMADELSDQEGNREPSWGAGERAGAEKVSAGYE